MTLHTRTTKSNGTTEWQDNEIIRHDEHNSEWNSYLTKFNGDISDVNIKAAADIGPSKVGDHASSDAEFTGVGSSPGDSLNPTLPTDLTGEVEALRHRINAGLMDQNVKARNAAGSIVSVGWLEPPMIGPNLLTNPGFETQTGGAGTAPDGWTLSGVPTTIDIEDQTAFPAAAAGTDKRSINIIGNSVGITQAVAGLKPSTKYRVGVAFVRTAQTVTLTTSGGLGGSADYGDVSITDNSTSTFTVEQAVVQTNVSGDDLTLSLTVTGAASAEVNAFYSWFYEMGDDAPVEMPGTLNQYAYDTPNVSYLGTLVGAWEDFVHPPMSLSQHVPGPGYILKYECNVTTGQVTAAAQIDENSLTLEMQIDSGGWVVVGRRGLRAWSPTDVAGLDVSLETTIRHVVVNPVPGSNYQFRLLVGSFDLKIIQVNPFLAQGSSSSVELELRKMG